MVKHTLGKTLGLLLVASLLLLGCSMVFAKGEPIKTPYHTAPVSHRSPEQATLDDKEGTSLGFTIPLAEQTATFSSAVQPLEKGFSQRISLASSKAPTEFSFSVTLPPGAYLDYVRHYYTGEALDGSVGIFHQLARPLASLESPLAQDAAGNMVSCQFRLQDNQITLAVHHDRPYFVYPITVQYNVLRIANNINVNDFATYFLSGSWITRNGVTSLSLKPKMVTLPTPLLNNAWHTVVSRFGNNAQWANAQSLYDQYRCHQSFAKDKEAWNLEPSRPVVNGVQMIISGCNH